MHFYSPAKIPAWLGAGSLSLRLREPPGLWHPIVPSGTSPLHHRVAATPRTLSHFTGSVSPLSPATFPMPRSAATPRSPRSSRASTRPLGSLLPPRPWAGASGGRARGARRRGRAEARRGRRRVERRDSPARGRGGGLLTHRGPRGAAARPPPPAAICGGGRRGPGLPGVGRPSGGFASTPRSLPRAPSGRGTVTVCLFPRPPG